MGELFIHYSLINLIFSQKDEKYELVETNFLLYQITYAKWPYNNSLWINCRYSLSGLNGPVEKGWHLILFWGCIMPFYVRTVKKNPTEIYNTQK